MTGEKVLEIFSEITRIPRESGHEQAIGAYLVDFAKKRGLPSKMDKVGNVLITKPASMGREGAPTLVLQCHQDMVCEKVSSSDHDFTKDPIDYVIENGWMVAKETTLGADDGIGIAACLALLDSDVKAGKLECLFTVSEETGMDGAMGLEEGFFTGKTLINLDSEDEGELFVGCAGGVNTMVTFDYTLEDIPGGYAALRIRMYNTTGGHSGDDINKGRINTVQQMARFLDREDGYRLVSFNGGGKHNAIARETDVVVAVPKKDAPAFKERFLAFGKEVFEEYHNTDPTVKVSAEEVELPGKALERGVASRLVSSLVAVHHGVLSMSQDIEGLVQTSSNLASVKMERPGVIDICTSQRSSSDSEKDFVAQKVEACFRLAGAKTRRGDPYPGWTPNMKSHILKVCVESYTDLFGYQPKVKAIHAGLECGLFLEKFPGMDMISFGPTLRNVHCPGEKLDLASNDKFVAHLVDVVERFSKQ